MTSPDKEFYQRYNNKEKEIEEFYKKHVDVKREQIKLKGSFLLRHDEAVGENYTDWKKENDDNLGGLAKTKADPDTCQDTDSPWNILELTDYQVDQLVDVESIYLSLTERYQQVFRLSFVSKLKQNEVAKRMNTTRSVVNNIIREIKKKVLNKGMSN